MLKKSRSATEKPITGVRHRRFRLRFVFGSLVVWAALPYVIGHRVVVINTSPSVKPGLYVRSAIEPAVGRIVDFRIPDAAQKYVRERTGHGGEDWFILKPIGAGPGDRVDCSGDSVVINGRIIAPMPPELDNAGRTLPVWRESRTLGREEFFVLSTRIPNSFDSRCYGPITRKQIASVRRPLITW